MTTVKNPEASRELTNPTDVAAVHLNGELGLQHNYILNNGEYQFHRTPWKGTDNWWSDEEFFNTLSELSDVVRAPEQYGRTGDEGTTLFVNNGFGLQSAALSSMRKH